MESKKYVCECGSTIKPACKSQHKKSKRHQAWLKRSPVVYILSNVVVGGDDLLKSLLKSLDMSATVFHFVVKDSPSKDEYKNMFKDVKNYTMIECDFLHNIELHALFHMGTRYQETDDMYIRSDRKDLVSIVGNLLQRENIYDC
jgi:hypothetical protein